VISDRCRNKRYPSRVSVMFSSRRHCTRYTFPRRRRGVCLNSGRFPLRLSDNVMPFKPRRRRLVSRTKSILLTCSPWAGADSVGGRGSGRPLRSPPCFTRRKSLINVSSAERNFSSRGYRKIDRNGPSLVYALRDITINSEDVTDAFAKSNRRPDQVY